MDTVLVVGIKADAAQFCAEHRPAVVIHGQPQQAVFAAGFLDVISQQAGMDAYILHKGAVAGLHPAAPWSLDLVQGLAVPADPGMVDVKPVGSLAKMEIHGGPVGQLCIVDAHRAAPPGQIGQRLVGGLDVVVVGDGQLFPAGTDAHPLSEEIAVLVWIFHPVLVFVLDLLLEMGHVEQGRVGHAPVLRIMDLLLLFEAADKREKSVVRFSVKQNPPAAGQVVIQGPVRHITVGSKDAHPRLGHFALAGDENSDVVVIGELVDLVEDHHAGSHAVPAFGVVGASFDDALVFPALHHLLGVVEKAVQFFLVFWGFEDFGHVLQRRYSLLLIVGTDVDVVVGDGIVWRNHAETHKADQAVLAGAAAHHVERCFKPWEAFGVVGAKPEADNKLLPGEKFFEWEVFGKAQVVSQPLLVDYQILSVKDLLDHLH